MRSIFRDEFETRSFPRSLAAMRRGFGLKSMTTLPNMTFRHALIISLVFTSAACFGADAKKSSPEDFIRSLYRFHQPGKDTPAWFADKRTLSKYFDKELTTLFLKDDECKKREQGVCNLDFDPIYDGQDFEKETTNLQIAAVVGQPDLFNVTFTNLGTRTLVYKLTNTPSGWRISDIKSPEGPSLKEILSRVGASNGPSNNSTASPTSTPESQPGKSAIAENDFSTFWKKFKSAVMAGDKATVAEMTKFPLSMPYGVKAVKNKEDFLRRYNEIFKGEANAAQCFGSAEPHKESDRQHEIYCPFKETPDDRENAPIRFIFELTKGGWRFVGLDNVNE